MVKPRRGIKEIRVSTYFLIVILGFFLTSPLPGVEWAVLALGVFVYFVLKNAGKIKKFEIIDALLIPVYFLLVTIVLIFAGIFTLQLIPWWKIVLFGILIEAIGIALQSVPVAGDFIAGFIGYAIGNTLIGGFEGMVLSVFMFFVLAIPGHIPGLTVAVLVILKIISGVVF